MMYSTFPSWRTATQRWLIYRWEIQCYWKRFSWIVIWPMRRNQSRFLSMPAESPAARLLSFAKFSGATTRKMKPPRNERKICWRTTLTYFLANPNLEGEIHLKGGRFVTSQIFNLECYTIDHHCISYFIAFWLDPRNSTQLEDPRRELGISLFSYLSFSQILKIGSFDFNYFIFYYFNINDLREGIK